MTSLRLTACLLALLSATRAQASCGALAELLPIQDASGDRFGWSVDVSGNDAIIGQPGDDTLDVDAGAAWTARWNGTAWVLDGALPVSSFSPGGGFGHAVAIEGDLAAVTAIWEDGGAPASGVVHVFVRELGTWREEARLIPAISGANDAFGWALALSGQSLLVGAPYTDSRDVDAGAAYVFHRDAGNWSEQTRIVPTELLAGDGFGSSVALDLPLALVGAPYADALGPDSGLAWSFIEEAGAWLPDGQLVPAGSKPGDGLGWAVALDADVAAVSSIWDDDAGVDAGSVSIFHRLTDTWSLEQEVAAVGGQPADGFGWDLSLSDGVLLVGVAWEDSLGPDSNTGAVHSLEYRGGAWRENDRLIPADLDWEHGLGQALSHDAGQALIGALWDDAAGADAGATHAFSLGGGWQEGAKLVAPDAAVADGFGSSAASTVSWAVIGSPWDDLAGESAGTVQVFGDSSGSWAAEARLSPPGLSAWDAFGYSVAVGPRWLVASALWDDTGGLQAGAVQLFEVSDGAWRHVTKLLAPDAGPEDGFGHGVALDGDRLVVGSPWDDDSGLESGSAHVHEWLSGFWEHRQKLLGGVAGDGFGHAVTLSGDTLAVGAPWTDASGLDSGVVHIFVHDGTAWQPEQVVLPSGAAAGDAFGISLALQGDLLVVGAPYADFDGPESGAAWVYQRVAGEWLEISRLAPPGPAPADGFGWAVALDQRRVIVSSIWDDAAGLDAGAADVFLEGDGTWPHLLELSAADAQAGDGFGQSAALSAGKALVSASWHDQAGTDAGAAYLLCATLPEADCANGLDEDADGLTDCDDEDCALEPPCEAQDFDGDGVRNDGDCAVFDAGAFAEPGEVNALQLNTNDSAVIVLSWTDPRPSSGDDTEVTLAIGELTSLHAAGVSEASCATTVRGASEWLDDGSLAGLARFVLARAQNACGPPGETGWGETSEDLPRLIACP